MFGNGFQMLANLMYIVISLIKSRPRRNPPRLNQPLTLSRAAAHTHFTRGAHTVAMRYSMLALLVGAAPLAAADLTLSAAERTAIEAAIAETKTAVEGGNPDTMNEKAQALAQVAMKLGQAIYEKEQAAAASPEAEAPKADDGVVDAEFSEVDDNKA